MLAENMMVIPDHFYAKKKILTIGTDMYLKNDRDQTFGRVVQRLDWGQKYELLDHNDQVMATSKSELFKLGTHFKIYDQFSGLIGSFEHELLKSFLSFKSKFVIKDQNNIPRLYTEQLDFFTTDVNIFDGHKNFVCSMKKPFFQLRDKWEVKISGPVDRRIIAMIPNFLQHIQDRKKDYD